MESKNIKTLRNAHQAFSAKRLDQSQQTVAERVRFTDHGRGQVVNSRGEFRGWMESHFAMSSDMRIVDARYIDAGDYVIAQFRGRHPGWPAAGVPSQR
ncbi:MAG: nuclear transport factor 2 family protein [Anaerolineae bacterium]|uniref:nuclear transport factor 2 family protein n=1 Tax=Candidatus Amarolinea dominans TaxID=3140696 RepID=UPI0031372F06|nr:nuclear transport factor 2 family protein [Anaerolineae bacterium]